VVFRCINWSFLRQSHSALFSSPIFLIALKFLIASDIACISLFNFPGKLPFSATDAAEIPFFLNYPPLSAASYAGGFPLHDI
jgi:hypothetical protein